MRARIEKTCTVVCGPGSIVEITQDQFLALGDAAVKTDDVSKLDTKEPRKPKADKTKE